QLVPGRFDRADGSGCLIFFPHHGHSTILAMAFSQTSPRRHQKSKPIFPSCASSPSSATRPKVQDSPLKPRLQRSPPKAVPGFAPSKAGATVHAQSRGSFGKEEKRVESRGGAVV